MMMTTAMDMKKVAVILVVSILLFSSLDVLAIDNSGKYRLASLYSNSFLIKLSFL